MLGLTLILLTWKIWWATNNASRWQIGFNSVFKGLIKTQGRLQMVSVVSRLCVGESGALIPAGTRAIFLLRCPEQIWGQSIHLFICKGESFSWAKRLKREAEYLLPSRTEVMNDRSQTSISHVFMFCTGDGQIYIFRGSEGFTFGGGGNWKNSSIVIAVTHF